MSNMMHILLYGVVGTLISMTLFVMVLSKLDDYFARDKSLRLDAYHTLLLANFLSNWETHSCILILDEKEYPTLTSLMFGETMVNDAVIIALFNSIKELHKSGILHSLEDVSLEVYGDMLIALLKVSFFSVSLGIVIALAMCFIMRLMRNLIWDNAYLQMMLVLVAGYLSFMVSEIIENAGALTIFCAGFVLSYYAFHSMSEKGQILTKVTVHFLGFIPESFIFAYIGMKMPVYLFDSWNEVLWLTAIIFGSFYIRAFSVYFLYFLGSLFKWKIDATSFKSTTMLVFAGMIRGIVLLCLLDYNFQKVQFHSLWQ